MAKNAHRQHRTKKLTHQRQISFSITWTRQEPRGLVSWELCDFGSSGSQFEFHCGQLFISLSLSFSKWGQLLSLSHVRRWPPHMRASEACSNLSGGYYRIRIYKTPQEVTVGIYKPLAKVYVLKWALGNRNLHKKSKISSLKILAIYSPIVHHIWPNLLKNLKDAFQVFEGILTFYRIDEFCMFWSPGRHIENNYTKWSLWTAKVAFLGHCFLCVAPGYQSMQNSSIGFHRILTSFSS